MTLLSNILSSRVRAEILRLLFGLVDRELHVREIERLSRLTIGTVQQDLKKLLKMDLIESRKDGNRLYYRANKEHPVYQDLRNLVLRTDGLVEIIREALLSKKIRVAFVFGSLALNRMRAASDVDLMVIGSVSLREISSLLMGVSEKIGREVNPHVMSVEEFNKRKRTGDHFLSRVLESPILYIIGNENELAAMGG
jgi:DNA-binding transcriptional ArsR family regulator